MIGRLSACLALGTALVLNASALSVAQEMDVVHGDVMYVQDFKEYGPRQRTGSEFGGIARLATVIKEIEVAEGDPTLVMGGELVGGSLFNSVHQGRPFVEAFNELGADVGNFGNHDFDKGVEHTRDLIDLAEFQWISSNLTTKDGHPFSPDGTTAVVESGDLRIGYVALTEALDRTPAWKDVVVQDHIDSARKAVASLAQNDVDVIVLLTQISKENTLAVMEAVPELAVALREENGAEMPTDIHYTSDDRVIVGPDADYGSLVHLDITKNRVTGEVQVAPKIHRIDASVPADTYWQRKTKAYEEELKAALGRQLASTEIMLDRPFLGVLAADSYREYFNTDLGWQNGGGIRAELEAGGISRADTHRVLPFGNQVVTRKITGQDLWLGIEQGINHNPHGGGGFPRIAGAAFEFDPEAEVGQRLESVTLEDGTPLDLQATYTMAISCFPAEGGDGVTAFAELPAVSEETIVDVDAFAPYLEAVGTITGGFDVAADNAGWNAVDIPHAEGSSASSGTGSSTLGIVAAVLAVLGGGLVAALNLIPGLLDQVRVNFPY